MTEAREAEISLLFTEAHTHNVWLKEPVSDAALRRIYELARMGPTGGNSQPLRVLFVKSAQAKERLRPLLNPGNVDKTMSAPVTAIIAYDTAFYEQLPRLSPERAHMREVLAKLPEQTREQMAKQSANLQAGYLILATRALGLDCGPMGGFDASKVDAEFFADSNWRSILLINLGYGDHSQLYARSPRLDFDEACRIE